MKKNLILPFILLAFVACNKEPDPSELPDDIHYELVSESIEVPYHRLDSDSVAWNIPIGEVVVFDSLDLDLDKDNIPDIMFSILDLTYFNGPMPDYPDSLAAIAHPLNPNMEIVDASGYGYCSALTQEAIIDSTLPWNTYYNFALGTISGAGEFAGNGPRYLGYRLGTPLDGDTSYMYGWIQLELTLIRDTLLIHDFAINLTPGADLEGGQK